MTRLRGLAWDHRRCWGPLDASVGPYCANNPGLEIEWDRRSLYEFGEGALGDQASAALTDAISSAASPGSKNSADRATIP